MRTTLLKAWIALQSRSGQGLVEYALILILAVAVLISLFTRLGMDPPETIGNVANTLGDAS